MDKFGKLEEIEDLRKFWQREAHNFTPWLRDNIELLADAIGMDLTVEETESSVGDFKVDILACEDGGERKVIIENQLEETNHDHLGKLITYASGKEASVVIWVVRRARDEHKAAIAWLNNHTDEQVGFFLCEIKVYRIGNSEPAVKFEVIEQPNDWSKAVRNESVTDTQWRRHEFWEAFQKHASCNNLFLKEFKFRKPSMRSSMVFPVGSSLCHIGVLRIQKRNELAVELCINRKDLFHRLHQDKDVIEEKAGLKFDWRELPGRKVSRIQIVKQPVDFEDESQQDALFAWVEDVMLKMKGVFKKYL